MTKDNLDKCFDLNVKGYGMSHKSVSFTDVKGSDEALVKAINLALADSNLTIDDIDLVYGFANGDKNIDNIELNAYKEVFKNKFDSLNVVEIKEHVGESRAAAASLEAAHASLLLSGDIKSVEAYNLKTMTKNIVDSKKVNRILVTSYSYGGSFSAVILEK